ncbi:MAG: TRAP transporter large permease subunit [Methyloprofundus sp.]|nr:TRAP transporter large permease subunit [Methyloprofundus sp.]
MDSYMALWMFLAVFIVLLSGYPVAFVLSGTALMFALLGLQLDTFDPDFLAALPNRLFGIMNNETLIAVPLFVFMGVILERAKIAESLLEAMAELFGSLHGGLGIAVTIVGMLMAASTGIVGATVVTMGLLSLPTMLKRGYDPAISCGIICASGTLGQIIPPSIVLVLLGDVISTAYQQAQLDMGIFAPETISVGDLFAGALVPGFLLVFMYLIYISVTAWLRPDALPRPAKVEQQESGFYLRIMKSLLPPLLLILSVLGSIIGGLATPTEAAAVGAVGALILALSSRQLTLAILQDVMRNTTQITSMVFMILIGAALFSLVFRGFEGDELIIELLSDLPGGKFGALFIVMLVMFLLGFVLDFIEITFVIVPIVGPVLLAMGLDPVWLGIMIALNLQTSFLTPPFGFALFYLRGVAPAEVTTGQIYKGVMPFIVIQLLLLGILAYFPELATWLPSLIYA